MREARFTKAKLDDALARLCGRLGLDHRGARLVRFTNNAVYLLAGAPVVVRFVASRRLRHRVYKVVAVARYLARNGVPAVRLYPGLDQPLIEGEHLATVWSSVRESDRRATPGELGRLLRAMHALPVPPGVARWDPLDDVQARIADAEHLDDDDRQFLLSHCASVRAALNQLEFPLPRSLIHGDAHAGNVLVGPDGPVLCDFDSACAGPPEWDLVPLAVGVLRFGDDMAGYRALADALGFDVMSWEGFGVLRAARELKLTTSVLPILRSNPGVTAEFRRRLADMRAGRDDAQWQRYR
ncbi:aminoglycoside phosphotransferase family protein [Haloechinothrix sp. LS1_15]|uniref:phosphotransferase enzyme family protein n=1 Tax=Haloechinothrix sp. LS1_15 TaxID=2652248 RepID=UPI002947C22D|nr:aminoglycoside phosphotransferase family protein [Haloechinothrix sp. LS1_15]MDV6010887.1 aminoglycoside phosphotransferase family protein [Haloechinothrix sp. LS1_15]